MNLQEKKDSVTAIRGRFDRATIAILTRPNGIPVGKITSFRRRVCALDGEYKVAKNRLAVRAVEGSPWAGLAPLLEGQTALVFGYGDPVSLVKEIVQYAKASEDKLVIQAAVLDGQLYDEAEVGRLAKLESLEVLRGKLLGLLLAPGTTLVRLLNEPAAQVARVLAARAENGAPSNEG